MNSWFTQRASLKQMPGVVSASWRRFLPEDWPDIFVFLRSTNVHLLINMRNEGPTFDVGYYRFKDWISEKKYPLEFWDLDFERLQLRRHHQLLTKDILEMLGQHGIQTELYNSQWLGSSLRQLGHQRLPQQHIGFFTGAGQISKRWPVENWRQLARILLERDHYAIDIYCGVSKSEKEDGAAIVSDIRGSFPQRACTLFQDESLEQITERFWNLDLLVSNDTFAVHLACALGIPVVGLYTVTSGRIWGGNSPGFRAVQSRAASECTEAKTIAGNCLHFYGVCPSAFDASMDVTPEQVYIEVDRSLNNL